MTLVSAQLDTVQLQIPTYDLPVKQGTANPILTYFGITLIGIGAILIIIPMVKKGKMKETPSALPPELPPSPNV